MKRICTIVFALSLVVSAQGPRGGRQDPEGDPLDLKLPSGKTQRDEIAKADYKKNLEDAATLAQLSAEVHDELDKAGSGIVPLKALKKLDDIEKLTRGIRARLKRY